MTAPLLVVRADETPQIGSGHVMRCLALSQAWIDGAGSVAFVGSLASSTRERMEREGIGTFAATAGDAGLAGIRELTQSASAIVLDGYEFDFDYQSNVMGSGVMLVVVDDDAHHPRYAASYLLNPGFVTTELYTNKTSAELLLGPKFALIRRELGRRANEQDATVPPQHLLVAFGGADPKNLTPKVLQALTGLEHELHTRVKVRVLLGPMASNQSEVHSIAARSPLEVEVVESTTQLDALYASTDLAIVAPGVSALEVAAFGVPQLNIAVAENQLQNARGLAAVGASEFMGEAEHVTSETITSSVRRLLYDPDRCRSMSRAARSVIDGNGARRVADLILSALDDSAE